MNEKCLAFASMDATLESARTATAFCLMHAALDRGHDVDVFAWEGAAGLASHPDAAHGRDAEQEVHPRPRVWVAPRQFDRAGARALN
jgi:tRNA 2-thiouridine synthesizing protein D